MTLLQLKVLREVARHSLNISAAARALNTSQPGISRQILLLEQELGVPLLIRQKNKVVSLSPAGQEILAQAHSILNQVQNIAHIADEVRGGGAGKLVIVTTHLHARYTILKPFKRLMKAYPNVKLFLFQADADSIPMLVRDGAADIGLSTAHDSPLEYPGVANLRGAVMKRCAIMPLDHPLASRKRLQIDDFAAHALVASSPRSRAGGLVAEAFRSCGIEPTVIVEAADSDVIKAYVREGFGVGIVPRMILESTDEDIRSIDVTSLFPLSRTNISIRVNMALPQYLSDFIEMVAPDWTRKAVRVEMLRRGGH